MPRHDIATTNAWQVSLLVPWQCIDWYMTGKGHAFGCHGSEMACYWMPWQGNGMLLEAMAGK